MSDYPARWEADVVLRDGRPVHVRPITADDASLLREFHGRLSPETIYYRFFAPYPELSDRDVERFTTVDHSDRVALVATMSGEIVGVGRYDRIDARSAEVAFVVRDDYQGRGLGSILLEHLAAAARERGIGRFVAEVLPANRRMLATFRDAGFEVESRFEEGAIGLGFDIEASRDVRSVIESREHRAESRSVRELLAPVGVAIVGASRTSGTVGHELVANLVDGGFPGRVVVVHPEADEIHGVRCVRTLAAAGSDVDLVVIAVRPELVPDIIEEAAEAGARGVVIVSGGFADEGRAGRELQSQVVSQARSHGLRVIGPNALGVINTDPEIRLNASLVARLPRRGGIGMFSQSGTMGGDILARLQGRGLGVSSFVSAGNRADLSTNDVLQFWEDDEATDVVVLYVETIGNPRKFARICRRLSAVKPVLSVRGAETTRRTVTGLTTSLPAEAIESVFAEVGVIRADSLAQLFDAAALVTFQPLPRGNRVAVVGNSAALGLLAAAAAERRGLVVSPDSATLGPRSLPADLVSALSAAASSPDTDAVLFLHAPSVPRPWDLTADVVGAVRGSDTTVVAVLVDGSGSPPATLDDEGAVVPVYAEVDDAIGAIARALDYQRWRESTTIPDDDAPRGADSGIEALSDAVGDAVSALTDGLVGERLLDDRETTTLLAAAGIRAWELMPVTSADDAVAAARSLGWPVVLKSRAPGWRGRPELGGTRLNLADERAVHAAYAVLASHLDAAGRARLVVQRMAPAGIAWRVVAREDAVFGPVVELGLAGPVAAALGSAAYAVPPFGEGAVARLIRRTPGSSLIETLDGAAGAGVTEFEGLLERIGDLIDLFPAITRVELSPIVVSSGACAVLGAEIAVTGQRIDRDVETRRLPRS